ncbi:PKD domain-containing protein [Kitasatospora sp. NPDC058063]|uniref:PKD domain-containing protein n=1 Tax=unclassified Kitasatospora TaxID=2633591 RepID=UPI0036DBAEA2
MRIRHAAGLSAAVVSAVVGLPLPAAAAEPAAVLYVQGGLCKDSGPGTQAQPLCTVQAAADRVLPGQTVEVAPGTYPEDVTVRRSGEPGKPITFRGTGRIGKLPSLPGRTSTFPVIAGPLRQPVTISGQHDVVFSGFDVTHFELDGVSRVELSGNWIEQRDDKIVRPAVAVTGASDHVRIERSFVRGTTGGVKVGPGIAGTVIAGNDFASTFGGSSVSLTDAPGTVVTNNTTRWSALAAIDLAGSSDHATITNNVVDRGTVRVSAGSVEGTTLDYNTVSSPAVEFYPTYSWADADYRLAEDLRAATGQGRHETNSNVQFDEDYWPLSVPRAAISGWHLGSVIDSAGPQVPGVPTVDLLSHGAFDYEDVANTGPDGGFRDRGAYEVTGTLNTLLSVTPEKDSDPLAVKVEVLTYGPPRITGYTYNFGDGTSTPWEKSSTERHVYAKPGTYTVRLTVTDEFGSTRTNEQPVTVDYTPAGYTAIAPTRILDTRAPGSRYPRLGPGETMDLDVRNRVSGSAGTLVPPGATAVVLNLTATEATADSHLDVSTTPARSNASNLNFGPGQDVANLVTVPVGPNGTVVVRNNAGYVHTVADVLGYFTTDSTGRFTSVAPARLLDTRSDATPLVAGAPRRLQIAGTGGVPAGATSAVLNVTATESASPGFVAVYPGGTQRPAAGSNLNTAPGRDIPNQVVVPLGADGSVEIFTNASSSHLVVDVFGYYSPDGKGLFTPVVPTRLMDSRNSTPFGPFDRRTVDGVPAGATAAVVNLTATGTTGATHLTAWATGTDKPGTSNLNATPGLDVPNHATVPVGSGGRFDIANNAGTTDVVVDLFGYYRNQ